MTQTPVQAAVVGVVGAAASSRQRSAYSWAAGSTLPVFQTLASRISRDRNAAQRF